MPQFLRNLDRYVRTIDYFLLIIALVCSGFGLVLIYSATATLAEGSVRYVTVQSIAIVLGVIGFIVASCIPYEKYTPMWRAVLLVNVLFQLSLVFFGYEDGGNRSWLRFGNFGIQPAELGKLLFIFTFAKQLNLYRYQLNRVKSLLFLGGQLLLMLAAIILPSHDVGVALSYVFIAAIMLFAAGLSLKWFAGGAVLCCAAVPILWQILSDTQKNRILVLFDPSVSPDTYWQQEQSRIAIGAGKLFGQGFMNGSQTQNNMLPEKQTDFIFGVAGEEWGMIGCLVILVLLNLLIFRIFYVAYQAKGQFSSLMCVGVGSMFLYQTYENIFMCLGIGPVMGLTLPFFSYGGTSMVTVFLAVGIVAGFSMRAKRQKQLRLAGGEEDDEEIAFQQRQLETEKQLKRRSRTRAPFFKHTAANGAKQGQEPDSQREKTAPQDTIRVFDREALSGFSDYVKEKVLRLEEEPEDEKAAEEQIDQILQDDEQDSKTK